MSDQANDPTPLPDDGTDPSSVLTDLRAYGSWLEQRSQVELSAPVDRFEPSSAPKPYSVGRLSLWATAAAVVVLAVASAGLLRSNSSSQLSEAASSGTADGEGGSSEADLPEDQPTVIVVEGEEAVKVDVDLDEGTAVTVPAEDGNSDEGADDASDGDASESTEGADVADTGEESAEGDAATADGSSESGEAAASGNTDDSGEGSSDGSASESGVGDDADGAGEGGSGGDGFDPESDEFKQSVLKPASVSFLQPLDGQTIGAGELTLKVTPVPSASKYVFSASHDGAKVFNLAAGSPTAAVAGTSLAAMDDGPLLVTVTAVDENGEVLASDTVSVLVFDPPRR